MHLFHHDDSTAYNNAVTFLEKQKLANKKGEHFHVDTIKNGKKVV